MTKIGFVILTWNSEKCIGRCLESIFTLDGNLFRGNVVIVDNGSQDGTERQIAGQIEKHGGKGAFSADLLKLDRNYGTTVSRNIGIRKILETDAEYVCILDSDTVVNTKAFVSLTEALQSDRSAGIVGPRMRDRNGVLQQSGRDLPTLPEKVLKVLPFRSWQKKAEAMEGHAAEGEGGRVPVGYLLSACWLMRRGLFEELGPLDEKIFYSPEDAEYCIRCHKAGYSVLYCRDAEIVHEWQRLSRKKLFSVHNYEHIKGLIHLFWKYKYIFRAERLQSSQGKEAKRT